MLRRPERRTPRCKRSTTSARRNACPDPPPAVFPAGDGRLRPGRGLRSDRRRNRESPSRRSGHLRWLGGATELPFGSGSDGHRRQPGRRQIGGSRFSQGALPPGGHWRRVLGCPPGRLDPPGGDAVSQCGLPGGARDVGGDDVGRMPVQAAAGPVVPHRGPRVRVRGGLLHLAQRHPGVQRGGDACLGVWGVTTLAIPARRAALRAIRPAPCRSSRRPAAVRNTGPPVRSPTARSIARAVRGASGIVTTLPPLRVMVRVRCPRSRPRCSISAPAASDTRSPFSASSEIRACSDGGPIPAATSRAPSSLRSSAAACDS
jgi:hypothetical protein